MNSLMEINLDELTYEIRGAMFEVFKELGPGLLESVYEAALLCEFQLRDIKVINQLPILVKYKGAILNIGFRLDILVEDEVIIEIKSVKELEDVHKKQLFTYLKLTGKRIGILVNFNSKHLVDKESIFRIVNNY